MVTMTVIIKVRSEKQKEFLQAMRCLQKDRMESTGIKVSNMYENEDRTSFSLMDEWETVDDLERYCQGENFRIFLGALKTLCEPCKRKASY